ncbi:fumarylacetoacetate hydrolase family protein [Stieleria sp. TO1_6]|uniref:fumarylacetoacetate hydrolase family protein n=1 Tax=Stieleria tagensis TaxID=2956795 RepID=UPI00209A750B|nr:fumarylacetoacetate hydrolase family protein [Stieleria tagensis]MCO8122348.1 fumarylacetoacetate hydrolase family protein [Stieleria tagensis]
MSVCCINGPDGRPQYALYRDGQICPLRNVIQDLADDFNLFELAAAGGLPDVSTVQPGLWSAAPDVLLPPVPKPEKVFCIGLNYRDHAIETNSPIPSEPVVFSKFNTALIGHGQSIQLPSISSKVDYEAELVVVIGRQAKNISADEALEYVFGYTCGHDVSARDWQKGRPGGQWLLGKSFDTFAPVGPCIVTRDELPDPADVRVRMKLNGEVVQDSTTAQLIFDIPTTIAHLSKFITLAPGDLIFTGTPPGVGDAKDPPVYLKPGDHCSVIIDGVGTLTNPCQ